MTTGGNPQRKDMLSRLDFLRAQPWLIPLDETLCWPEHCTEIFSGLCTMALVGQPAGGDVRLHFSSPLLGSRTETRMRLALQRPNVAVGGKRPREDTSVRMLVGFDSDDGPLLCHISHRQIGRLSDNVNEWRAAAAAASGPGCGNGGSHSATADGSLPPLSPPFLALQFGPVLLRLTADSEVPDVRAAQLLGGARDAMLRELPRAAAVPAEAPVDELDQPAPCVPTCITARVAPWQAFVRCTQHLESGSYPRPRLLQMMAVRFGEACGATGHAAAKSVRMAEAAVRARETEYVHRALAVLTEPACAVAEARRVQARAELSRAYRGLLASIVLPSRAEGMCGGRASEAASQRP
jgi:hypothetical protein